MNYRFTVHFSTSFSTTNSRPKTSNSTHRSGLGDFANPRNQSPNLCSLDQPSRSFEAYAVSIAKIPLSRKHCLPHWKEGNQLMTQTANKATPNLHKRPQPPLSHPGATPDSDRAKKPPLAEPPGTDAELSPGD